MMHILTIAIGFVLLIVFAVSCSNSSSIPQTASNPQLRTILETKFNGEKWEGTPLDEDGRFRNDEHVFEPNLGALLRWRFSKNPQKEEKANDNVRLKVADDTSYLLGNEDCVVWLGHACFFMRLGGKTFLTDPVFGDIPFVKRLSDFPINPEKLVGIDYLLISHDHHDHCNEESIQQVVRQNPGITILSGLGMNDLWKSWLSKIDGWTHQEAGWYQQFTTDTNAVEVFFLPARHWSRRGLFDLNSRLWGAFVFKTSEITIYFSGDTGFGRHFHQAKLLFPDIDLAIMGAGAYSPRWFMHPNHIAPEEAVEAFHDLNAKTLLPMHYGTFDLSDEPPSEPARLLLKMSQNNEIKGKLLLPALGQKITMRECK